MGLYSWRGPSLVMTLNAIGFGSNQQQQNPLRPLASGEAPLSRKGFAGERVSKTLSPAKAEASLSDSMERAGARRRVLRSFDKVI